MAKDISDITELIQYLLLRNPFSKDSPNGLRNKAAGITAPESVICNFSREIGMKIIKSITGEKVSDFSIK